MVYNRQGAYVRSPTAMSTMQPNHLAAMSQLFSSGVIRELARTGRSPKLSRLARQSSLIELIPSSDSLCALFEVAFSVLKQAGSRDEYVYKSALAHKILLGRHSLRTACMLNEFRAGRCKADIVILNGTSTVYEVKSERDSLSRLERQIDAYRSVFARVCVVAAQHHASAVFAVVPKDVGILCLTERGNITTMRQAMHRPREQILLPYLGLFVSKRRDLFYRVSAAPFLKSPIRNSTQP